MLCAMSRMLLWFRSLVFKGYVSSPFLDPPSLPTLVPNFFFSSCSLSASSFLLVLGVAIAEPRRRGKKEREKKEKRERKV
ncbi:hypothetical protein B0I35DRAFT_428302, partial [Stachybotrys elegans]